MSSVRTAARASSRPESCSGANRRSRDQHTDVGFLRLLGLQPDEVLDEVEHGHVGPCEQVLAGEQGPVERPGPEHRPVVHRAT